MRGNLSAYEWLPLDSVSYAGLGTAACGSRHPSVANYFTVELAVLQEMTQMLADLFGLKLPGSPAP